MDPGIDYSKEEPTLVEFSLEEIEDDTLLPVTESGFSLAPAGRRLEAYPMNEGGRTEQLKNNESHITQRP